MGVWQFIWRSIFPGVLLAGAVLGTPPAHAQPAGAGPVAETAPIEPSPPEPSPPEPEPSPSAPEPGPSAPSAPEPGPSAPSASEPGAEPRPEAPGAPSVPAAVPAVPAVVPGGTQDGEAYARALIERARARRLADSVQWRRLGHWKRSGWARLWFVGHLDGVHSQADGTSLFLSPRGKSSPGAELEATLRAFLRPGPAGDAHALCRFPARYEWLRAELDIDPARLPRVQCAGFEEFLRLLAPRAVVVVFSGYYLGQAASAFGHTFFRVEKHAPDAGTERRQLLDMGVDYSARVTTSNSLLYAVLGMTGGFRGSFRRLPYYYKVREYNDFESRDLWEYRLALDQDQVDMFVAHLWELGHTYFDYLYLTENCSYHILSALEVVNPAWNLLGRVKNPVIPADTIKALGDIPGLVAEVTYRPSLMTQFRRRTRHMSETQLDLVEALSRSAQAPFPDRLDAKQRIEALDAAADLIDIRWAEDVLLRPASLPARTKIALLARRAAIPEPSAELVIEPPVNERPDRGHGTRRIAVGAGMTRNRDPYLSLGFRATLHDLADPVTGYPELSQIEFLPMELRTSLEDARVWLEQASLVRILHLNAFDRFNRSISWNVNVGAARIDDRGCPGCLAATLSFGGGVTRSWLDRRVAFYAMLDNHAMWAPDLDGIRASAVRLGLGPMAGLRVRLHQRLVTHLGGEWIWLPGQEPLAMWSAGGTLRWGITRDIALDLDVRTRQGLLDGRLSAMLYY